jgi:mannose-6-phosphate isomerase
MKLSPVFKEYLWGGTNLKKIFLQASGFSSIAESWVLSAHREGVTVIENGEYEGAGIDVFLAEEGAAALGTLNEGGILPLLSKWIDAADDLSVQVHPNDEYSLACGGGPGKKEAWYVVDCEPGAVLYYGFKRKLSRNEFRNRAEDGTITAVLNRVHPKVGDVFFVDSGVVHALGKGMTVVEIGSNCNVTYRIYDYLRKDSTGNLRDLHIEQAAEVALLDIPVCSAGFVRGICDCGDFSIEKIDLAGEASFDVDEASFHSLICIEGNFALRHNKNAVQAGRGGSFFLPAGMGGYTLSGNAVILKTTV